MTLFLFYWNGGVLMISFLMFFFCAVGWFFFSSDYFIVVRQKFHKFQKLKKKRSDNNIDRISLIMLPALCFCISLLTIGRGIIGLIDSGTIVFHLLLRIIVGGTKTD